MKDIDRVVKLAWDIACASKLVEKEITNIKGESFADRNKYKEAMIDMKKQLGAMTEIQKDVNDCLTETVNVPMST